MARLQEVGMTGQVKPVRLGWRRFLRFSVRGLVVVVLVIGAGLGWFVRGARIQREAVAAITKAGGSVYYDWEWSDGKHIPTGRPWAPKWLTDRVGVDYFGHVTQACLGAKETDATLLKVGRLCQLRELNLNQSSVTDAGLQQLDGLTDLNTLCLGSTQITDSGLVHLKRLTKISRLVLSSTRVTNAGLVHLSRLTNLSTLELEDTQVSNDGLAQLRGLTNLICLTLDSTHVSDAGLANLKGMTDLVVLYFRNTQVTDAGLVHLKGLTKLSSLYLSNTQVSDAGMKELLASLPNLTIIRWPHAYVSGLK
jgi:internalin A